MCRASLLPRSHCMMIRASLRTVWAYIVMSCCGVAIAGDKLTVHEWGTFTSFQDEHGLAIYGINTDDEPVPDFVHRLFYRGEYSPTNMPPRESKGAKPGIPSVSMRLETPVTYFHLPPGVKEMTCDVTVEMHGGWLTEYFPFASAQVDDQTVTDCKRQELKESTVGRLIWNDVRISASEEIQYAPETTEHVWLAPRNVKAAQVTVGEEGERFLFYRGVARRNAPLRVRRDPLSNQLTLRSANEKSVGPKALTLPNLWLVHVTSDGRAAYRTLSSITLSGRYNETLVTTPGEFGDGEFSRDNLQRLRTDMQQAIMKEGLFEDEAAALLNTWELSYFQSPGVRLFFLVPQAWTDLVLPIKLSIPAEMKRVMVGRIELVSPEQRRLLVKLTSSPPADLQQVTAAINNLRTSSDAVDREKYKALASGRGNVDDLGVPVPECYQTFLAMGRFRSPLLGAATWIGERQVLPLAAFGQEVERPGSGALKAQSALRDAAEAEELRLRHLERAVVAIEQKNKSQPPQPGGIMFLGDSVFKNWDVNKSFPGSNVARHGIAALSLKELRDVAARIVIPAWPSTVVVQVGTLDVDRNVSIGQCAAYYQSFVDLMRQNLPQTQIIFTSIRPNPLEGLAFNVHADGRAAVNERIREICKGDSRQKYVDLTTPLVGANGRLRDALFGPRNSGLIENGFDLNDEGYRIWADVLQCDVETGRTLP